MMSKNQNVHGPGKSMNQNNVMSEDPQDGKRKSFNLQGEGEGPAAEKFENQGEERLAELGRQGSK